MAIRKSSLDVRMLKILHGSDFHFGKPHLPEMALAFIQMLDQLDPDVVVLSGDFTQRARVEEYKQVKDFLGSFRGTPVIVTPGNHDIPLYRINQRILNPFKNYREYISRDLDEVTRIDGAVFVALNSADPYRSIINGRINEEQLDFAATAFGEALPGDIKVLVTHHPLVHSPDEGKHAVLPESKFLLESFSRMGVELVLSGHVHRAFTRQVRTDVDGQEADNKMLMIHSGTTASNRGRVHEKEQNTLNVMEIDSIECKVNTYWYEEKESVFLARQTSVFQIGT